MLYRVPLRRTVTEYGYAFIEADSAAEATREILEIASQGQLTQFDVEGLIEEQYDDTEEEATPCKSSS
jgi:hypothetical protein